MMKDSKVGYGNILFDMITGIGNGALRLLGNKARVRFLGLAQEKFLPIYPVETRHGVIKFYSPGRVPLSRAENWHVKEIENYKLIDFFPRGSVFWDIGANVGVCSLYAALKGDKVIAFEPAAMNYAILNKNIELNLFLDCMAYCIALDKHSQFDTLNMMTGIIGKGGNAVGQPRDHKLKPYHPIFKQGTVSFSMDELVLKHYLPMPTYMKIDVDGLEDKILEGAQVVLPKIRGLSIELDTERPDRKELIALIESTGLKLKEEMSLFNLIFLRE